MEHPMTLCHDKQRTLASNEDFDSIFTSIREPLVMVDDDLNVVRANQSFYKTFNISPEETEGLSIYDIGNGQWDIPKLRELFDGLLPEKTAFNDFHLEHDFGPVGWKVLHINARRIYRESTKTRMILLAIEDVTTRENYKEALEEDVIKRTAELFLAREEAEERRRTAENGLLEIKKLKKQLEAERAYLIEEIKQGFNHENIIGGSDVIKYVLFKIDQIAPHTTTVLVLGETGTGKELIARAVHAHSQRKDRALVKVNCATLPANLIESELFGHEKGSFTGAHLNKQGRFEVADGTTLFLDEIGELPLDLQAKLLRVVQDGEFERVGSNKTIKVDTRIIAATNRNLEEEVRKGRFREDLWYRLNVFPITAPPLRDRLDDIPLLVDFYVREISRRMGKFIESIPETVMAALQDYHWPGNIRELENVLERAVINTSGPRLHLADDLTKKTTPLSAAKTLQSVERDYIVQVLEQTQWKVGGKNSASEILGLDRSTLRARMTKLNIIKP
jgi:chemotaxis protein methyltransferase CheR